MKLKTRIKAWFCAGVAIIFTAMVLISRYENSYVSWPDPVPPEYQAMIFLGAATCLCNGLLLWALKEMENK